jgi:hypothetical protein
MTEIEAIAVDGVLTRVDEGGVCLVFTRRVLAGVEPDKEHPGVQNTKWGAKVVAELWMTKEMGMVLRKTLNDTLSGKPLPPPKEPEKPKVAGYE